MANFIEKEYIKYHLGRSEIRAHIDAVHAHPPKNDLYTGEIVRGVVNRIGSSGIIATISRNIADLNRPRCLENAAAIDEYRQVIREILEHIDILNEGGKCRQPYLHLAIHGMRNAYNRDIEVGTRHGQTCSLGVRDWLVKEIKKQGIEVCLEGILSGDSSKSHHRSTYGINFNTIQIEISYRLRAQKRDHVIRLLCKIVMRFCERFQQPTSHQNH
jgi:hypothetical protein